LIREAADFAKLFGNSAEFGLVMSVSAITSGSNTGNSAEAAILQAQATQYASDFASLNTAISSGDIANAQQALVVFMQDSATAIANGFDPVSQNATVRQDFALVKTALGKGDMTGAQTAFAALQKDMQAAQGGSAGSDLNAIQSAVQTGDLTTAQSSLASFAKDLAMSATSGNNPLAPGSTLFQDIRSLQVAFQSGNLQSSQDAFSAAQDNLSSAATSAQGNSSTGVDPELEADQTILQGLGGTPMATGSETMLQASTLSILQSLQASSSPGDGGTTGFAVTPQMLASL
jgi:hypothetical protein